MKATGIVRRIDELGRIVIPKEIRRTMRIRESDPLEIYTDRDGTIILKRYSPVAELKTLAEGLAASIAQVCANTAFISDRERVIACFGALKRVLEDGRLSKTVQNIILQRKPFTSTPDAIVLTELCEGQDRKFFEVSIQPIVANGDAIGAVGLICTDPATPIEEGHRQILRTVSLYIGRELQD
ncbi:MAG: stage V sporulation T C-terminal domain-containing protein [Clostridia bacterium]|nr:stage V sporulation T C-terminal domain-containing protein [Clostridia bacterium]